MNTQQSSLERAYQPLPAALVVDRLLLHPQLWHPLTPGKGGALDLHLGGAQAGKDWHQMWLLQRHNCSDVLFP